MLLRYRGWIASTGSPDCTEARIVAGMGEQSGMGTFIDDAGEFDAALASLRCST